MELTCSSCSTIFNVPDEKVPRGKSFSLSCPKCKNKISVNAISQGSQPSSPAPQTSDEGELDFVEEGTKTALLCGFKDDKNIIDGLSHLGYQVKKSQSPDDAINKIRFTLYDVIILHEKFGGASTNDNIVLKYLQPMPMSSRRKIFLAVIGDNVQTFDAMEAYSLSVNLTINSRDISNFEPILKKGIADMERFYKIFKETLVKTGMD